MFKDCVGVAVVVKVWLPETASLAPGAADFTRK